MTNKQVKYMLLVSGSLLFVYIVLRAAMVSFTHDEAVSFSQYAIRSWEKIFKDTNANNHLVNSIWMRVCVDWFGANDFLFRLPNVIAGGCYILFSGLLVYRLNMAAHFKVAAFLLINGHTLALEFFSLARGYGLSLGFIMITLYFVFRLFETRKILLYSFLSTVTICLAAISSFTVMNFALYCVVAVFFTGLLLLPWKSAGKKALAFLVSAHTVIFVGGCCFMLMLVKMLLHMQEDQTLYFGAPTLDDSVWSVTYGSYSGIDQRIPGITDWLTCASIVFFALSCLFTLFHVRKFKSEPVSGFGIFAVAGLAACIGAHVIQNQYMDVLYPLARTGVYWLPLFSVAVVCGFLLSPERVRRFTGFIFMAFCIFPVLSTLFFMNYSRTFSWPECADVDVAMQALILDAKSRQQPSNRASVSCGFELLPVVNYYICTENARNINIIMHEERGFQFGRNYYFLSVTDSSIAPGDFPEIYRGNTHRVIRVDENAQRQLLSIDSADFEIPGNETPAPGHTGKFSGSIGDSFRDSRALYDTIRDTLPAQTEYRIDAWINRSDCHVHPTLIISADRSGQNVNWRIISLHNQSGEKNTWVHVSCSVFLTTELYPGDVLMIYLSNFEKAPMLVDDFSLWRYAQ
ncbi:MAG TPA: hypothetical protein VK826_20215 [Bacteroidia bacterium]|nr:hypothetical protein [Bacteroidia bacterium]